jgi:tRNA-(ms[2]io[6]A)-hydroxylase
MSKVQLAFQTGQDWVDTVLADFDTFLLDHAAAEKKASGMAVSMMSHYSDKPELVEAMAELAIEELAHYREVAKLIHSRGGITGPDDKDPYINAFRKAMRKGKDVYFLDRLLIGGIVEARGAERFGLIAEALEPGELKSFYARIARSEDKHLDLFIDFAEKYFPAEVVKPRLTELIEIEAEIAAKLPLRAALH